MSSQDYKYSLKLLLFLIYLGIVTQKSKRLVLDWGFSAVVCRQVVVHLMAPLSLEVLLEQLDDEHTPCCVGRTMVISDLKHLGASILNFRGLQGLRWSWFSGKHPPQ